MKKTIRSLAAAAALTGVLCFSAAGTLTAHAEGSVQDVYAAMRRIGMPEGMINQAKNTYEGHPEMHDANGMTINGQYASYTEWAEMVIVMENTIWRKIAEQYGVEPSKIKEYVNNQYAGTTASSAKQTTTTAASSKSGVQSSSVTTVTTPETSASSTERPSDMNFIKMSAEEKKAYLQKMAEDERAKFLADMTTAERNSILKQMSTEDKADIMSQFADIGKQMGMNVTVDKIDGNDISYSVRDADGNLIDSSTIGTRTDDTGWDLTVPVLISVSAVLLSAGGIIWMSRSMTKRKEDSDGRS